MIYCQLACLSFRACFLSVTEYQDRFEVFGFLLANLTEPVLQGYHYYLPTDADQRDGIALFDIIICCIFEYLLPHPTLFDDEFLIIFIAAFQIFADVYYIVE